jgi:hypothetical protein
MEFLLIGLALLSFSSLLLIARNRSIHRRKSVSNDQINTSSNQDSEPANVELSNSDSKATEIEVNKVESKEEPKRRESKPTSNLSSASVITVSVSLILACVAFLLWPTPYHYDHIKQSDNEMPVRINRWNGEGQILTQSGWQILKLPNKEIQLPESEASKIRGFARFWPAGESFSFQVELYNGSTFVLTEVTVQFTPKNSEDKKPISQRCRFRDMSLASLSTDVYNCQLMEQLIISEGASGSNLGWNIVAAKGIPE